MLGWVWKSSDQCKRNCWLHSYQNLRQHSVSYPTSKKLDPYQQTVPIDIYADGRNSPTCSENRTQ